MAHYQPFEKGLSGFRLAYLLRPFTAVKKMIITSLNTQTIVDRFVQIYYKTYFIKVPLAQSLRIPYF
jgi:hypothetical protein